MGRISGEFYFDSRPLQGSAAPGLRMECAPASRERPLGQGRFTSQNGDVCVWDGRLDNREDLLLQLGQDLPEGSPDSALAVKLYQVRGIDGLRDLVGDWSLAIWDARQRRVVLASDYAGVRPLYYRCSLQGVVWSSSLSELAEGMSGSMLDEGYAAAFLTRGHAALRTPYRDILPVPPGHAVSVSENGAETRAFWSLPVEQTIEYRDERSYEEQLRALFREAVRVRLRADSPVCAELSGGLDSSSVVAMADDLPTSRGDLFTFSYTHKDCPDERYFRALEQERNLSGLHFEVEQFPLVAADQAGGATPEWWEPRFAELARQMNRIGSGVLLTGQLGDFVMGNSPDDTDQVTDYLDRGQYAGAAREAFAWSQSLGTPIYPILWRAARTKYFGWTGSSLPGVSGGGRYAGVTSLTAKLSKRTASGLEDALGKPAWREAAPGRRRRFRALSEMLMGRNLQVPETLQHISYAHPFAHRPLVEFMMAIPPGVVCRPGEPRRLMRRAFAELLPPLILKRRSKAAYGAEYRKALLPLAAEALRDPGGMRSVELGLVDRESVEGRLQAFVNGLDCNEYQLRQIILFEFWLRGRWAVRRPAPPRGNRVRAAIPHFFAFQAALST